MDNHEEQITQPPEPTPTPAPAGRGRTPLIAACAVLAVIGCGCLVGGGLLVYLDPFDWNLVARLNGSYDAAAEAVPADALAYVGMDLRQLSSADAERVFRAFAETAPEGDTAETGSFLQGIDEELERETGFNLSEDILPWVGQYAGIGITGLEAGEFGEVERVDFVFAASIRDRLGAEAFSLLLQAYVENESGDALQTSEHAGATIYELPTFQDDGIAFAIHRGLFLLAMDSAAIRASIDARSGESFMDARAYGDLTTHLFRDALLSVFITPGLVDELTAAAATGVASTANPITNIPLSLGAFSLAFVPEGIRVDSAIQYDPAALTELRAQQIELYTAATAIDARLPADTLLFTGGRGLHLAFDLARETMPPSDLAAFEESMAALEEELGFSLENDLLAHLDGEYALAVIPSGDGLLASRDVDLGLALVFETSSPAGLAPVLDGLGELIEREVGFPPDAVEIGGHEFFQLANPFLGEMLAYGVTEDLWIVATSASLARDLLGAEAALQDDPDYQRIWTSFPGEFNPVLYVDVDGILGVIREGMGVDELEIFTTQAAALEPIEFIAMGNRLPSPDLQLGRLMVFIASGNE